MNRKGLVASFGLVAGLAAVLSAQAPSSNGKVDQKNRRDGGKAIGASTPEQAMVMASAANVIAAKCPAVWPCGIRQPK